MGSSEDSTQFERQQAGREPDPPQGLEDDPRVLIVRELRGGDVDAHTDVACAQSTPSGRHRAGLVEHPLADLPHVDGPLGCGQELGWQQRAQRRVVPAQKRLERLDPPVDEGDDGLIEELELARLERAREVARDGQGAKSCGAGLRVEQRPAMLALLLRAIERQVRVAQQVVGAPTREITQSDPDAGAHHDASAFGDDGTFQVVKKAFGHRRGQVRRQAGSEDHGELVSSVPGHHVSRTYGRAQSRSHLTEELVTSLVAQGIIDGLEVVEVEDQEPGPGIWFGEGDDELVR